MPHSKTRRHEEGRRVGAQDGVHPIRYDGVLARSLPPSVRLWIASLPPPYAWIWGMRASSRISAWRTCSCSWQRSRAIPFSPAFDLSLQRTPIQTPLLGSQQSTHFSRRLHALKHPLHLLQRLQRTGPCEGPPQWLGPPGS